MIARLSDRTPLRIKLVAALLSLVAMGLLVISVAGVEALQRYLVDRTDVQLTATADELTRQISAGATQLRAPYGFFVEIRDAKGAVTDQPRLPPSHDDGTPEIPKKLGTVPVTVDSVAAGAQWRVLALPLPGGSSAILGQSLDEAQRTVRKLIGIDLLVSAGIMLGFTLLGVLVVRTSLRPLNEIEDTAEAIAAGDLSQRVPDRAPRTEVGRLSRSLNGMLGQIESAFHAQAASEERAIRSEDRMRRFVADASHELRTPLTAIRGFAEFYRQGGARSPDETDRLIRRIEDSAQRMGLLVEDLLTLARLDRQRPLQHRPVDLLALAADAVSEARVIAPGRPIELTVSGDAAFQVIGDEPRLRQALGNLLTNALTHTPPDTLVEVRLSTGTVQPEATDPEASVGLPADLSSGTPADLEPDLEQDQAGGFTAVILEVADHGPGMTAEEADRIFERFYRADKARSSGGTGLGLAIVAAMVAAHGGTVTVDTAPGAGATFRITLPHA
ncbi:MAG: histidine kinase [Actinomycetia bacterium]|nr:histidine kinase [Actinomycetes bacterium]